MPEFSSAVAFGFLIAVTVAVPAGWAVMSRGHFVAIRIYLVVLFILCEGVLVGWLTGESWASSSESLIWVIANIFLISALVGLFRMVKKEVPALSLEVTEVLAFDYDSGESMAIALKIGNSGAPSVARDYCVTVVDGESGKRFFSKPMQLRSSYWVKELPAAFGGRRPFREDCWLEGVLGKEPITRECNGFLLVKFDQNPFLHSPGGDSVNPEACLIEVECRDCWNRVWGPAVFQASKEHPIGFGIFSWTP